MPWRFTRLLLPLTIGYAAARCLVLLLAAPLAEWVLGSSYANVSVVLRRPALMPVIQAIHFLLGNLLMALDQQGLRSACQVAVACLNVVLNLWLIPCSRWRAQSWPPTRRRDCWRYAWRRRCCVCDQTLPANLIPRALCRRRWNARRR